MVKLNAQLLPASLNPLLASPDVHRNHLLAMKPLMLLALMPSAKCGRRKIQSPWGEKRPVNTDWKQVESLLLSTVYASSEIMATDRWFRKKKVAAISTAQA